MKKLFLSLFFVAAAGEIIAILVPLRHLEYVSKPLIMISLALYYAVASPFEKCSRALLLAIVFSLAGDVLLLDGNYFVSGLIAFMAAHIMYILAYRQHCGEEAENPLKGIQRIRLAFPIILAGTGLVVVLYPSLNELKFPVILYSIVLVLMVLNALFRYGHTTAASYWMVFSGAVLFMISDSLLAINAFLEPVAYGRLWVMITYMAAQFLIVTGLMRHG